jgi:hypothetical protein
MMTLFPADLAHLTRRDFLRRCGYGALGLLGLPLINQVERIENFLDLPFLSRVERLERLQRLDPLLPDEPIRLGRAVDDTVPVYDRPSLGGKLLRVYYRDVVLDIDEVTIGDETPRHNRVWYHIRGEGYAHSGKIQPVRLDLQTPAAVLPEGGRLVEISVPFTDIFRDLERKERVKYRLYYATVHWARELARDSQGNTWYGLWDDKYKEMYYARAEHLRQVSQEEIAPLSPETPLEEKRIEVWRDAQLVIAYERDEPVLISKTSTGGRFIDGDYTTPTGFYLTSRKRPSRHMASEDRAAPNGYDLPGVPWVCYITESGISFHGTFWHNDFGKPRSHGCINLPTRAAQWLYRWTHPNVPFGKETLNDKTGTRVDIL